MSSSNGYSKLKEVIVGRELNLEKRIIDFTFKHFYQSNLGQSVYDFDKFEDSFKISRKMIEERNQDLDNLSKILEENGVKVYRPDEVNKVIPFKTPSFKSELSSASNVRDMTVIIDDYIIETPSYVLNRYFENLNLYKIFQEKMIEEYKWIRCPHTNITEDTIDLEPWNVERDYKNVDFKKYVMAIDGAQFLRMNDKIIVNIGSYNHWIGYKWIESFFPNKEFYPVFLTDNHIDGVLTQLNENTFLVNPNFPNIQEKLPNFMKDMSFIYPKKVESRKVEGMRIASDAGMDINVLSIDPQTVIVNKEAKGTIEVLEEHGFSYIPIQLRHSEIFGGGIHCSTLDLERENEK